MTATTTALARRMPPPRPVRIPGFEVPVEFCQRLLAALASHPLAEFDDVPISILGMGTRGGTSKTTLSETIANLYDAADLGRLHISTIDADPRLPKLLGQVDGRMRVDITADIDATEEEIETDPKNALRHLNPIGDAIIAEMDTLLDAGADSAPKFFRWAKAGYRNEAIMQAGVFVEIIACTDSDSQSIDRAYDVIRAARAMFDGYEWARFVLVESPARASFSTVLDNERLCWMREQPWIETIAMPKCRSRFWIAARENGSNTSTAAINTLLLDPAATELAAPGYGVGKMDVFEEVKLFFEWRRAMQLTLLPLLRHSVAKAVVSRILAPKPSSTARAA